MIRFYIITLVFSFFFLEVYTQNKKITQKEIDTFEIKPNTPENHQILEKMLSSDTTLTGWLYYYRKKIYYHLSNKEYDSVIYFSRKSEETTRKSVDLPYLELKQLKKIYLYLGIALIEEKNYYESTKYLLKAIEAQNNYDKEPDASDSYIYGYLASNYIKMGDKKEALSYRLKIAEDSIFMSLSENSGATYNRIGILYEYLRQGDSALYYYRKAAKIYEDYSDYAGLRSVYNNLGTLYKDNKIDSTLYFYRLSKKLLEKYPDQNYYYSKYFTLSNHAYVLIKEGQAREALEILISIKDSLNDTEKIDDEIKELKFSILDNMIEAYTQTGQFSKAIESTEEKVQVFEKFHQDFVQEKLKELEVAYNVKTKDKHIRKLRSTAEEQQIIINQKNVITTIVIMLLVLSSLLFMLFYRQRKIRSELQTVNLKQRLLRSQLNPHFIFNALNTVSSLVNKNSDKTLSYISKLANLIWKILDNSREEYVSLANELEVINDYLELQSNFSQKFDFSIKLTIDDDKERIFIPPMFIQPFIENSIEHGIKTISEGKIEIYIRIDRINQLLNFKIVDNGAGIDKSSKNKDIKGKNSVSGDILRERLVIYSKSLRKDARFVVNKGNSGVGTEVILLLPYIYE